MLDDAEQKRYWLFGSKGLGCFDKETKQFYSYQHPSLHPVANDVRLTSNIINFYIDRRRRYWIENGTPLKRERLLLFR